MPAIEKEHTENFYLNVERVIGLLLNNPYYLESKKAATLRQTVMETLKVSEPQAKRYISVAKKQIVEYYAEDNAKNKRKAILRFEGIIRRAQRANDFRSELEAVKQLNIILGISNEETQADNKETKIVIEQVIIDKRS